MVNANNDDFGDNSANNKPNPTQPIMSTKEILGLMFEALFLVWANSSAL